MKCPHCLTGRIMRATDEAGSPDSHCYQCGYRIAPVFSPEALERIAVALQRNGRTESSQRKAAKRLVM